MIIDSEKKRLYYRRQYLLVPESIECPFENHKYKITDDYFLYSHVDLGVTLHEKRDTKIILLGDVFNYRHPEWSNDQILQNCFKPDLNDFIEETFHLAGRFVFIFSKGNHVSIFTDASATRKVFYSTVKKGWIASQPHLLARMLDYTFTKNLEILNYYHSEDFIKLFSANIGNLTVYDEIRQLLPNHYLDTDNQKIIRFWPVRPIKNRPADTVARDCASIIKGYASSIANRYDLMLPVTAGKDSRTLFGAFRNVNKDIYYYINKYPGMPENDPDLIIPRNICNKLGKEFHIETFSKNVDPDFEKIYFINNPLASRRFLPVVYHYYTCFPNRVNLPGNTASAGLEHFKFGLKNPDGFELARLNYGIQRYAFAVKYYEEWIKEVKSFYSKYDLDPVSLFYWEERLANWGTQITLDKDIAQEDINPYNSHHLVTLILSSNKRWQRNPSYPLHRKILNHLWSEYNEYPLNPGLVPTVKRITFKTGLLTPFYKIRFKLNL